MIDIIRRYFKVTSGAFYDDVVTRSANNKKADAQYRAISKEIGASPTQFYQNNNGYLTGFVFEKVPDEKIFRMVKGSPAWYPKKNNKPGRLISDKIDEVDVNPIDGSLKIAGLNHYQLLSGNSMHYANIITIPSDPLAIYLSIPWAEFAPNEDMAKHDPHFSWVKPDEFVEVKKWEVDRDIDTWNTKVKK